MFNEEQGCVPQYEKPNISKNPETPPKQPCEHKWVFQGSDYEHIYHSYGRVEYKRIDTYYCEKCLEYKEITAKYECSNERPYWFKE